MVSDLLELRQVLGGGQAPVVPANSDAAELSTLRSQLDELVTRVEAVADRYRDTPDSAIAVDLFQVERALVTARRTLNRALSSLNELAR